MDLIQAYIDQGLHNRGIIMKKFTLFLIILNIGLNLYGSSIKNGPISDPCKILLIGSSYFYSNDLAGLLENLCISAGKDVYIDKYYPCGLYLAHHALSDVTEAKIREQKWDFIVLQGVGTNTAYPDHYDEYPVFPALVTLKQKILENNPATQIIYSMPWAFEDGMTWLEGWKDEYSDMQMKIYKYTLKLSDSAGVAIAPVGYAWLKVLQEKRYPLHYLHISDWNHPSMKGSYLMACVLYSTIFMESLNGNAFMVDLPQEEASYFQTMASKTVLQDLALWNLTEAHLDINDPLPGGHFLLHQNFPNPFINHTTIIYEVIIEGIVSLTLYETSGKKVAELASGNKQPGRYVVEYNPPSLPAGMYYYMLESGDKRILKKLIIR